MPRPSFATPPLPPPLPRPCRTRTPACSTVPPPPVPVHPSRAPLSIVGLGLLCVDLIARVASFPSADAKVRSSSFSEHGGGNASNAVVAARRLGIPAALISVVGDDARGASAVDEVAADGVDTGLVEVVEGARTPFSYVIAADDDGTRTIVHTADARVGLTTLSLAAREAVEGADVLLLDGRHPDAAVQAADAARKAGTFVLTDFERKRDGAEELLARASGAVVKDAFARAVAGDDAFDAAAEDDKDERHLARLLDRGPEWVVATRGADGSVLVRRTGNRQSATTTTTIAGLRTVAQPSAHHRSTEVVYIDAVPDVKVVDATGGGDAFFGAVAYGVATGMPVVDAVVLASYVGAAAVAGEGARASPIRAEVAGVLETLAVR